jgi:hypothetical protein
MFVVVITGEAYPEVVGPFRSETRADAVAEKWNTEHDTNTEGEAHVRPCCKSINDIDD